MKNKWIKGIAAFLSAAVLCTCFAACGGGGEAENQEGDTFTPSEKQAFLGPIRQDEYLFGMGEIASDTMGGGIDGVTGEWLAETAGAIGAQSMRVWMHIPNIIERAAYSNEVTLKKHVAEGYHDYFAALKENGVKRIVVMNHQFLYPYDYVKRDVNDLQVAIHPIEEPEFYETWIQMYYECYKLLAEEFPEITFWECGNEFDSIPFFRRNDGTLMSAEDMGYIDADLCPLWRVSSCSASAITWSRTSTALRTGSASSMRPSTRKIRASRNPWRWRSSTISTGRMQTRRRCMRITIR